MAKSREAIAGDPHTRLLHVCAFLTGFSALLYETVWQRVLGLFSGSDVLSATLVISAYLSGLALGSLLASVVADRIAPAHLMRWYVGLTIAVGLCGAASTPFFYHVIYVRLGAYALTAASTYAVLFAALMVPTAMMGASFPLLGRIVFGGRTAGAGATMALLNGVNILGAVTGVLISGWLLVGTLGYDRTALVGAAVDIVAALLAVAAGRQIARPVGGAARDQTASAQADGRLPLRQTWTLPVIEWTVLTLASGFIAVSLEIVWLRLLSIYIKSNSYGLFAHLLAWVLLGFAIGSMWGVRLLSKVADVKGVFLWAQAGVVAYALASNLAMACAYPSISIYLGTELIELNQPHGWLSIAARLGRYVGVPFVILFPPTLLIGLTFPCAQRAIQNDGFLVGARVGVIQAASLAGNIAGGLATGLYLLDRFGSFVALRILGGIGLMFVCWLFATRPGRAIHSRQRLAALAAAVVLAALVLFYPASTWLQARLHNVVAGQPFEYTEDATGVSSLVGIGAPSYPAYMLSVDAIAESRVPFDMFHCYIGAIGALLHPSPESAFVVGVGSGATPYCMGVDERLRRVRAVEIVTSVLTVLNRISGTDRANAIDRLTMDPRYDVHSADARKDLTSHAERYDVIEADAVKPRRSHSGLLYSAEFFQTIRARLKPGGLFVQWEASPRVKATMLSVFPFVVSFDYIVVGSDSPIGVDRERILASLASPAAERYMSVADAPGAERSLIGQIRQMFSHSQFEHWTPDDARGRLDINTDLRPKDEFYLNNSDPIRATR